MSERPKSIRHARWSGFALIGARARYTNGAGLYQRLRVRTHALKRSVALPSRWPGGVGGGPLGVMGLYGASPAAFAGAKAAPTCLPRKRGRRQDGGGRHRFRSTTAGIRTDKSVSSPRPPSRGLPATELRPLKAPDRVRGDEKGDRGDEMGRAAPLHPGHYGPPEFEREG